MIDRYSPAELADALGLFAPTEEQAAVISAPPGPLVVIAGAGAGKTETMAARVVWLVANGYARPGEVLGLTFTRKAAGQLLRRVRTRLARLAGAGLVPGDRSDVDEHPSIGTYHAFAGTLLREHGLLLPVEPSTRLIGATELWQLAFRVVCDYPEMLRTEKSPATVTAMVLRLAGQLAEHLVDTDQLRDTHVELERLVHALPAGPRQRDAGPTQALLKLLATQTERTEVVPLIDALHQRMRAENVMDFGMQMSAAARLAETFPQVGEQLRQRYRVVLLDEYQDTGHAQRVALSALFGGGVDDDLALTAVGDPIQSIYGWRGASATNLPRFTTDFCLSDGTPAPTLELRTSWRNPPRALRLANVISTEARRRSVAVRELLPRPDAQPGTVRCALLHDVGVERDWLAEQLADIYHGAVESGEDVPTAAVLVRRNADAAPIADALTARGVPVEVVGLSGLLSVPEVADVVAMLRLAADPTAGSAAMRILTGPRWRLGAADVTALWRRAVDIDSASKAAIDRSSTAHIVASAGPDAESACLADAICDPGRSDRYSPTGYHRIVALCRELTVVRAQLHHPLPELVGEIRWMLGLDAEVRAAQSVSAGWCGTEHLDAFSDVVAEFASRPSVTVAGLLAFLDAAMEVENGLAPAELTVAKDRVQILTVHAAKGLEWQVVAVPHLSNRVFPSTGRRGPGSRMQVTCRRCYVATAPRCPNTACPCSTPLTSTIERLCPTRSLPTARRSISAAWTRSADCCTWPSPVPRTPWCCRAITGVPRSPSPAGRRTSCWRSRTSSIEPRPLVIPAESSITGRPRPAMVTSTRCGTTSWNAPGRSNRPVRAAHRSNAVPSWSATRWRPNSPSVRRTDLDVEGWAADVDALLAERELALLRPAPVLPPQLSVSALVDIGRDPDGALRRLQRRLPVRPDPHALLGTAFHDWVQRFFHAERLFDLEDLPGAVDGELGLAEAERLAELQAAFAVSPWASRIPVDVEVPFDMVIGGTVVRGRIDAVFADDDGGVTVVDWKTGDPPATAEALQQNSVQLAVYRLAWAATAGVSPDSVRAAFHYVRSGRTVEPDGLPDAADLARLLGAA